MRAGTELNIIKCTKFYKRCCLRVWNICYNHRNLIKYFSGMMYLLLMSWNVKMLLNSEHFSYLLHSGFIYFFLRWELEWHLINMTVFLSYLWNLTRYGGGISTTISTTTEEVSSSKCCSVAGRAVSISKSIWLPKLASNSHGYTTVWWWLNEIHSSKNRSVMKVVYLVLLRSSHPTLACMHRCLTPRICIWCHVGVRYIKTVMMMMIKFRIDLKMLMSHI